MRRHASSLDPRIDRLLNAGFDFWPAWLVAIAIGDAVADQLAANSLLSLPMTALVLAVALAAAVAFRLWRGLTVPRLYWPAIVPLGIIGALSTDILGADFGLTLPVLVTGIGVVLAAAFFVWLLAEATVSISAVSTVGRELLYWSITLLLFAAGNAGGDLVAGLAGFDHPVVLTLLALVVAVAALAHYTFQAGSLTTFWIVYLFTRPLIDPMEDILARPVVLDGLKAGTVLVYVIILAAIWAMMRPQGRAGEDGRRK